ncbi:MAG TPA: hypothetical protein VFZ65_00750 [Planctomycetota bacterium]|nr:hypothetical protein [Planctomycetota bacterium]
MNRTLFPTHCLPALLATLAAQQPPVPDAPVHGTLGERGRFACRVPIHSAEPDGGRVYGTWAAADSYKASFHGDVTFVPYLGSSRPTNLPVAWHSLSVRVGELELLDRSAAVAEHGDYRFELRLGRVSETWDVLEQSLEQRFVIYERPAAAGDLVVRGRIDTPLHAAPFAAAHRAIDFVDDDGAAIVRYGEAFAVDARGERTPITTAFDGKVVELRAPAAWLAGAAFPIAIDPLLTRVTLDLNVQPSSIDVVREDTWNSIMTVYARAASATDYDAYAVLTDQFWNSPTVVFTDITSSWSSPVTQVAAAGDPQRFCVVFERDLAEYRVRAHIHDAAVFTLSTSIIGLAGVSGSHDWRPDVGGQVLNTIAFTSTGNQFLIVYQRDVIVGALPNSGASGIYARTLDVNGVIGAEAAILSVVPSVDAESPHVNQQARRSGSAAQHTTWFVVYQRYIAALTTWRSVGVLVDDASGVQAGGWESSGGSPASHRMTPRVAGQSGRYLVACVETDYAVAPFKTIATTGYRLLTERVDWNPGAAPVNHPTNVVDGPNAQDWIALDGAAYDQNTQSHWALTMHNTRAQGGDGRATVLRTGFQGLETERQVLHAPTLANEQGIAGGVCFDPDNDLFVMSFARVTATNDTLYGNKLRYATVAAPMATGVSCSTAQPSWAGSQQIGAEFPSVRLASAPANLPAILAISLGTLDINLSAIGMTGCRLLIDNGAPNYVTALATPTSASGNGSIPLALPETLPIATLYFQWFHFDIGANPLDLVSTQRLRVDIVK